LVRVKDKKWVLLVNDNVDGASARKDLDKLKILYFLMRMKRVIKFV
jgi:hypothetical protein